MKKFFIIWIFVNIFMTAEVLADSPSDWAVSEVAEAVEKGIVPDKLQGDYTKYIKRSEFCELCMNVLRLWNDKLHFNYNVSFSDTNDKYVLECAELGIVNGKNDNKFAPDDSIKRQEAAKMLYETFYSSPVDDIHTINSNNVRECCIPHSFDDGGLIKSWARDEITHMYRYGVMLGVSDNNYEPDGFYTREQAICTFLRLYKLGKGISSDSAPECDYYPYGDFVYRYIDDGIIDAEYYDEENYHNSYIDSKGNKYTEKEKGYVYPFNLPYGIFNTVSGVGVSMSEVWDKNGNGYGIKLSGGGGKIITPDYVFGSEYGTNRTFIHRFSDKKEIFDVISIGEDLFIQFQEYIYEPISVINSNGDVIVDFSEGYTFTGQTICYNGIFVLGNKDGFSVINSNGEVLKNFSVSPEWKFLGSIGSNMQFSVNEKDIFYRAVSGKYFEYDDLSLFANNNNEAIAYDFENTYILNADGSVKFKCGKDDNVRKQPGVDFYEITRLKDGVVLYDIVDKKGNVIKSIYYDECKFDGFGNGVYFDKSGVCAYITNRDTIKFFDFFGNDLKEFDLAEYNGKNNDNKGIASLSARFINGLLWVRMNYSDIDDYDEFYVTPYGKILRACLKSKKSLSKNKIYAKNQKK